jgi:hypothetical protein
MLEAEFVSEVTIAFLHGMQDKKKSISMYYEEYDDVYARQALMEKRFREVVDAINQIIGDQLADTEFRRPPLLYTLFCVIYHRLHGLRGETIATKKGLSTDDGERSQTFSLTQRKANQCQAGIRHSSRLLFARPTTSSPAGLDSPRCIALRLLSA